MWGFGEQAELSGYSLILRPSYKVLFTLFIC